MKCEVDGQSKYGFVSQFIDDQVVMIQITVYLNRQNMNSELSHDQSEMDLVPRLPGRSLCHIPPKIQLQEIELDVNQDLASNNSQRDLPKFETFSQKASTLKPQQIQNHPLWQIMLNKNQTQVITFEQKQPKSSFNVLAQMIIWVCYFIATTQTKYEGVNALQAINIVGVALSFILCINKIFIKHESVEFSDILHGISLITSVALYFYSPSDSSDPFRDALIVFRSFRLLFPLNYKYAFKDLICKYWTIINKIIMHSLLLMGIIIVVSLIIQQSASKSIYDRCRPSISINTSFPAIDSQLCGSRTCPQNYTCLNPFTFDETPNQTQVSSNPGLSFGFFTFSALHRSTFTFLQIGTLSQSSTIIQIYQKQFQIQFISIIAVVVLIAIQIQLFLILAVILSELTKIKEFEVDSSTNAGESNSNVWTKFKSHKSLEVYSNALTFGVITNKQASDLKKSTHSLQINKEQPEQRSLRASGLSKLSVPESKQAQPKEEPVTNKQKQEQNHSLTRCQMAKIVSFSCLALIHFVLALLFSVQCLPELLNRAVGIGLCCFTIVWTSFIAIQVYQKHFGDDKQQQKGSAEMEQNYETIMKIQQIIFVFCLLDYICRIFQHSYILEQMSPLTALLTALLFLRVVYLPLALGKVSPGCRQFNKLIKAVVFSSQSVAVYIFVIVIFSAILANIVSQFYHSTAFIDTLSIFVSTFSNSNWMQQYKQLGNLPDLLQTNSGLLFAMKYVAILVGQFFILKLIYSQAILTCSDHLLKNNVRNAVLQIQSEVTAEQVLSILQQQKSLYFFEFNGGFRNSVYSLLKSNKYRSVKVLLIKNYVWLAFIGYIIGKDSDIYTFMLLIIDIVLLCDSLLSIIALRFWGKCSFIDNQWYNFANFAITIALICNAFKEFLVDCFFLRSLRVMLLMRQSVQMRNSYRIVRNLLLGFRQLWRVMLVVFGFNYVWCVGAAFQSRSDIGQNLLKSLSNAFLIMQKGFDLPTQLTLQNKWLSIWSMQSAIHYLIVTIPLNACCIALMLKQLLVDKHKQQHLQINKIIQETVHTLSNKEAQQLYQKQQIKEQILDMQPIVSPHCFVEQSYLLKLSKNCYFGYVKLTVGTVASIIQLLLGSLGQFFSESQVFRFKIVIMFCFMSGLMFLLIDAIAYRGTLPHFTLTSLILLLAIPGHFIMLVPSNKIQASQSLKSVLTFFVSIAPLTFINFYFSVKSTSTWSWFVKMQQSIQFFQWFFFFSWFYAAILALCLKQDFLILFFSVLVGLLGGNYTSAFDIDSLVPQKRIVVNMVNILVCLTSFILTNGLIALALFELHHRLKNKLQEYLFPATNTKLISRKQVQSVFSFDKFIEIWSTVDPQGSGVLDYSKVLHNVHHFMRPFINREYYIQFLLKKKEEVYNMKLQILRSLDLPVRAVTKQSQEGRQSVYMITFYDMAARLICLALQQDDIRKAQSTVNVEVNSLSIEPADWAFVLQVDSDEWNERVSRCISKLSSQRVEAHEYCSKFSVQKKVDMKSSSLASVIGLLPKLRNKMRQAKLKLQ